jgi:hypothetical protein
VSCYGTGKRDAGLVVNEKRGLLRKVYCSRRV